MNCRYKIQGEDIIFSLEEHEKIQSQIKTHGHALMTFRGGSIGIDTSKIAFFKETEQMTEEQEKAKDETLRIEGAKWKPPTPEDIIRRNKIVEEWKERRAVKEMGKEPLTHFKEIGEMKI